MTFDMLLTTFQDTRYFDLLNHPVGVDHPFPGNSMDIPTQPGLWLQLLYDGSRIDPIRKFYLVPLLCPACKQTVHYTDDEVVTIRESLQGCNLGDIIYMERANTHFGEILAEFFYRTLTKGRQNNK